jgi:uncharacterized Fe-S cluster protein YjdI
MDKEYKKGNLTVIWKKEICIHAANCAKELPSVFKPKEKPWVDVNGAEAEEIKAQINRCPSGALSYVIEEEAVKNSSEENEYTSVETMPNGPLLVHGKVTVKHGEESITKDGKVTAFCRCGASGNKPFCDGTHKGIDFKD